eukprot:6205333-Pleurochrysis_carterae.AAC.5
MATIPVCDWLNMQQSRPQWTGVHPEATRAVEAHGACLRNLHAPTSMPLLKRKRGERAMACERAIRGIGVAFLDVDVVDEAGAH